MFQRLSVWNDRKMFSNLQWYYAVATNKMPAKYLIAQRVEVDPSYKKMSYDDLMAYHAKLTEQLIEMRDKLLRGKVSFQNYNKATPNLLNLNVEIVDRMLKSCNFCQWDCQVDRSGITLTEDKKTGACQLGEQSRVGSYFHHRGEELIYRGKGGSGTIFFTSCNMRCTFCQNGNISQDKYNGTVVDKRDLANIMWELRMEGCHNINFVGGDPTIHLHTIIQGITELPSATPTENDLKKLHRMKSDSFIRYRKQKSGAFYGDELNVPMLWNANFFMSQDTMQILRSVIDIWLPDFKFGTNKKCATRLSRTPWYFETVTRNLEQLSDWGEEFTIRHLVMPNHVDCCTKDILDWIKESIPEVPVNIMDQYHPDSFTNPLTDKYNPRYEDISRLLRKDEFDLALQLAKERNINFETITFE